MYAIHLRLTENRVVDFLLVLIELFSLAVTASALGANIDWKLAFLLQRGQFDPKFQVEGVACHEPFFLSQNQDEWSFIWYKNVGTRFFCFVTNQAFDRRTDGRTDSFSWLDHAVCNSCSVVISPKPGGRLPILSARLWLPSWPISITTLWPVANCNAWWQGHQCVNNMPDQPAMPRSQLQCPNWHAKLKQPAYYSISLNTDIKSN